VNDLIAHMQTSTTPIQQITEILVGEKVMRQEPQRLEQAMESSGQFVTDHIVWRECLAPCGFAGNVDATFDPETDTGHWVCPDCGFEHYSSSTS